MNCLHLQWAIPEKTQSIQGGDGIEDIVFRFVTLKQVFTPKDFVKLCDTP